MSGDRAENVNINITKDGNLNGIKAKNVNIAKVGNANRTEITRNNKAKEAYLMGR